MNTKINYEVKKSLFKDKKYYMKYVYYSYRPIHTFIFLLKVTTSFWR